MNVRYAHANPRSGQESFVLKFEDEIHGETACVLVDAGRDVDVDSLLGPDEYLAAVLLTHAHLDHYVSLGESIRDGAPVYASRATASILETVLDEGADRYDIGDPDAVLDALTAIDGEETVLPGVTVSPVPAGHAPGAVGYLLTFEDGHSTHSILATGDFSTHSVAGFPPFPTSFSAKIDAMCLTVATNDEFESALTDAVATVVERARAGSRVLVTASGLTGLRFSYVLGHLGERYDDVETVVLAGHGAKLYDDLDYTVPNVDPVPVFDDPEDLFERGSIVVAGPEVPVEGGSKRLFDRIRDDPGATLVQLTGGPVNPVERAGCTVYDYELVDHPPRSVLDGLIEECAPIQLILEHGGPSVGHRYRDEVEVSFVWAHNDDDEYLLYDGEWVRPPWMSDEGERWVRQANPAFGGGLTDPDEPVEPVSTDRPASVDLELEGLDLEALDDRLRAAQIGQRTETTPSPDELEPGEPAGHNDSREQAAVETNGGVVEADAVAPDLAGPDSAEGWQHVLDRLDSIEARLDEPTVRARVIDAGDGVTLLRLLDDVGLDDGTVVSIRLDRALESGVQPDEGEELRDEDKRGAVEDGS